jgi:prepilin-type processing-associated H-X9-DG protein
MRPAFARITLVSGALILLACMGISIPIEFIAIITLGWIWFLARTLPEIQVAWAGVATASICLILFAVGTHGFLGWLYPHFPGKGNAQDPGNRRWKWRWTGSLVAVTILMFVAGMSVVGMTHQLGWLLTSKERLIFWSGSARDAARRAQSTNNLKQIGLALHAYGQSQQSFPAGGTFDRMGRPLHSWQAMILPYIELQDLHDRIDFSIPWNNPRNAPLFQTEIPVYLQPGVPAKKDAAGYALSHYAANAHMLGGDHARALRDVTDGTDSTLMAGEAMANFKAWGDPTNWRDPTLGLNKSPHGFGSPWPGGVNFLFVDGSVRFIKNTIDPAVLKAVATPAGQDKVGSDQY